MTDAEVLADRFEEHRTRLRAVAYRILGSLSEADDAVQETWLRLSRTNVDSIDNLGGWLTTVVARICLNLLRLRATRQEEPLDARMPDPVVSGPAGVDPEQAALIADAVSLALLVVLQTLTPAERLAFVLHDMFAVPFDEIAPMVGRTPTATRQLASRARRRIDSAAPRPDADLALQRAVVDAFLAAAREGDVDALVATLDPAVTLRADAGSPTSSHRLSGAEAVAAQALLFNRLGGSGAVSRAALVNGVAGSVSFRNGRPAAVLGFTVADGRIVAIDILADPKRLSGLDLTAVA